MNQDLDIPENLRYVAKSKIKTEEKVVEKIVEKVQIREVIKLKNLIEVNSVISDLKTLQIFYPNVEIISSLNTKLTQLFKEEIEQISKRLEQDFVVELPTA
jgi:hypothetical protein